MSSILKALRKLEEQQAARRGGISHTTRQAAPTGLRWRATTVILISVFLAVAGTVAVMNSMNPRTAPETAPSTERQPETSPTGSVVTLPEPVQQGEPVTNPVVIPEGEEEAEPEPAKEKLTPVRAEVPRSAPATSPRIAPAVPSLEEPESPEPLGVAARPAPKQSLSRPQPETRTIDRALAPPQPPQTLTVSGIAWQKGESDRIAMVNGSPVSEGTIVAGARVVEIKPDRVRFSRDGSVFEVPIGTGATDR